MLTRRGFGACAICSAVGLVATGVAAQGPGFTRTILKRMEFPGDRYVTLLVKVEIEPGARIARHTHPGVETTYVMDGSAELSMKGAPDRTYGAGEGFQVPAEVPHSAQNGDKPTRLIVTYVVEKDKPLASPA